MIIWGGCGSVGKAGPLPISGSIPTSSGLHVEVIKVSKVMNLKWIQMAAPLVCKISLQDTVPT